MTGTDHRSGRLDGRDRTAPCGGLARPSGQSVARAHPGVRMSWGYFADAGDLTRDRVHVRGAGCGQSFPGLSRASGGMRPWVVPAHKGVICPWVPSPSCTPGAPSATATAIRSTRQGADGGGSAATFAAPARSAREPARSRFRRAGACRPAGCVRRLVQHHVGPAPPGPAPRQAAPPGPVRVAAVAVAAGPDRGGGGGDDGGGAVAVADRAYRDSSGPPWRRRHHHRACGHWRAAQQRGPATACHPAAAARHYPGGTRARHAGRPG